jgi:hypothetical protein
LTLIREIENSCRIIARHTRVTHLLHSRIIRNLTNPLNKATTKQSALPQDGTNLLTQLQLIKPRCPRDSRDSMANKVTKDSRDSMDNKLTLPVQLLEMVILVLKVPIVLRLLGLLNLNINIKMALGEILSIKKLNSGRKFFKF